MKHAKIMFARKTATLAILAILLYSFTIKYCNPTSTLTLVLNIDKTTYNVGDTITISSIVTKDGTQLTDALVAIEVDFPNGDPYVIRTVQTGEIQQQTWFVEIKTLYTCDSYGNPQNLFKKGKYMYIALGIKNNSPSPRNVQIPIYIQFSNNVPFKALYHPLSLEPGQEAQIMVSLEIPSNAVSGEATIFSSAYSDLPENLGAPYCPERKTSFYIETTYPPAQQQSQFSNISFNLPKTNCVLGTYIIYGSATQQLNVAITTKTFNVILVGDINGDLIVETRDVSIVCRNYGKTESSPGWNPTIDLNNDGIIDTRDVSIVCKNYGKSGILPS